jgi:hypothetical protein
MVNLVNDGDFLTGFSDFARFTSSTAQGRGKSFKDRKP